VVLVGAAAAAGWLYRYCTHLEYVQLTDDVWMISGFGGNVGVLRTDAGAVVVDTMNFAMQGERIEDLATNLTGQPVAIVINTHYHRDPHARQFRRSPQGAHHCDGAHAPNTFANATPTTGRARRLQRCRPRRSRMSTRSRSAAK
jgi:hypothetical protein